MTLPIHRGLLVSTDVPAAAAAFSAGLERIAAGDGDPGRAMRTSIAADPYFLLPQLVDVPKGDQVDRLRTAAAAAKLQPWERSHVEVVLSRHERSGSDWALAALAHVQRFAGDSWMFARLFAFAFFDGDAGLRALVSAQAGDLVKQFPSDDEYRCLWSRCLCEMGFPQRALRVLGTMTERRPDWPAAWHAQIHALHGLGRHDEAADLCVTLRGRGGKFEAHLAWHEALIALSSGNVAHATRLFEESCGPDANEGLLPVAIADLAGFCWAHIAVTGHAPPDTDALRRFHQRARASAKGPHVELQCALLGGAIAFGSRQVDAALGEFAGAVARRDWGALKRAAEAVCRGRLDACGGSQLQRACLGLVWLVAARREAESPRRVELPPALKFCEQHPVVLRALREADVAA